ncbi:MAG: hypothetical protein GXY49_00245 [Syntrophomonadaceae bacterium]|nr:hypothetical protein [Syntrophomonadaceae bacterium]
MKLDNTDLKNSEDFLNIVRNYREAVIRASAGAYLHNLGKVSKEFNLDHQGLLFNKDKQKQYYFYQHIIGLLKADTAENTIDINQEFFITDNSKKHFASGNDTTEDVFSSETRVALARSINALFKPFNDCKYRWGDFIEYLGQGPDDARLYFNKDAKNFRRHDEIIGEKGTGHPYYISLIRQPSSLLAHLMSICHRGASGGEKDVFYLQKQNKVVDSNIATPFGFETRNADKEYSEYDDLREKAEDVIKKYLSKDEQKDFSLIGFIEDLKPVFQQAMADSQRPFNNISVHDIGHSGMALLKSAIWTLRDKNLTHDSFWTDEGNWLRWRLLRFSLDGISYLAESVSMGDLRVRKNKLDQYLDQVKQLLEEEYPVATEVYRDENGSVFVFPDWGPDSDEAKVIKQLINDKYGIKSGMKSGESVISKMYGIEPSMQISTDCSMAHPGDAKQAKSRYIGKEMQNMILNPMPANPVPEAYKKNNEPNTDICPYCGLRLISNEYKSRMICKECMDERGGVAKKWWGTNEKNQRFRTIWLEEIADDNGRLALITGRFFPERFIELDYLPIGEKKEDGKIDSKKLGNEMVSAEAFARQRRIWETCREFWKDIDEVINKAIGQLIGSDSQRLSIGIEADKTGKKLSHYHAYELIIDGNRLMVMWTGADFITLENLNGFEKRNGLGKTAKEYLAAHIGKPATIRIPGGYGSKSAEWGSVIIEGVGVNDTNYISAMHILTEPRTFMYLLPADKAIEIVKIIKAKYEKEMGQVRGRLPLHLGIVYANRYTPLRAILDAGQRMFNQEAAAASAEVVRKVQDDKNNKLNLYWQIEDEKATTYWPIALKTGGDSNIEDDWYPYFPVSWDGPSGGRTWELESPASVYYGDSVKEIRQMIHVENLLEKEQFILYPSTFDFEYLDSAGVRFEIAYEKRKRKSPDKAQRPYLLEQVDELNKIWEVLKAGALNRNQIYALRDAIANKREEWKQSYSSTDETFKQFCRDMLVTASWNKLELPEQEKTIYPWEKNGTNHEEFFDQWADYAVRGWFEDVVQLYLQIMKNEIGKGGSKNDQEF